MRLSAPLRDRTGGLSERRAPRRPWWRAFAWASLLLGVALPASARMLAGPPGALVHVRWQPLDADARRQLETRFHLTDGTHLDGTTWRYTLTDLSGANIRALVGEPAAEDTHHIERRSYRVSASAARTPRPRGLLLSGDAIVRVADVLALLVASLAALVVSFGRARRTPTPRAAVEVAADAAGRVLRALGRLSAPPAGWLSRGVPELDARTAGVFRIAFGIAVLAFFATHREDASSLTAMFHPLIYSDLHAAVLERLGRYPTLLSALTTWLLVTGAAFTVGLFTRLTYSLFVAGVLTWSFIAVAHDSTHPNSVLVLTLVALLPSRWGDACSVDQWARRMRGAGRPGPAGREYGYSVWVPGLVFGVALAAAAWAKLAQSGPAWILNGTVKYHVITDSFNAPVQWGLQIAGHPWLAIAASAAVVAVESLVVTAAFARSERYRMAMGVAAFATLAGFWLFMGVFWPAWWILLLAFLPWRRLGRRLDAQPALSDTAANRIEGGIGFDRPAARAATAAQVAAIVFVIAQQLVISALEIERAPMFTNYPMYSWTFASSDEFDAAMVPYYRIIVATDAGVTELACNAPEDLVADFRAALQGSSDAASRVWRAVRGCRRDIRAARSVTLEGDRHVFDWDRLAFQSTRASVVLGPLRGDPRAGQGSD